MSGMTARGPGAVAAALESDRHYGIIMDGIHVHKSMVRMAYKHNPNVVLITDAMPPVGTDANKFSWFGETIYRESDRLVDSEGRLAGAYLTQNQALANAMLQLRISLDDALPMATSAPAQLLGLASSHARVEPGCVADLMLIDETTEVHRVWRGGHLLV